MVKPVQLSTQYQELSEQIKWLTLARAVFSIVLVFSAMVFSGREVESLTVRHFYFLYMIAGGVLALSAVYLIWLRTRRHLTTLAYIQISADICLVSAIIFITGCFYSIFTFLYLVVIIYTAMLLPRQGGFVAAILSSLQYGLLIELEYFKVVTPISAGPALATSVDEAQILYRIIITISACFAVAALSGILSFQLRKARQDLKITREHLKRVEKMSAVDELISGIAHEIKNPLASLSGSIQMLRDETEQGSTHDRLMQIILRETGRLEQIVTDIRLIAKPSRHNAKKVNMARAIEDVKTLFNNAPDWKNRVEMITRLDPELFVMIDPVHLQQILWNLVKNAAESITGNGKIFITLEAPKNKRVYLTVRDTGKGIDTAHATHIFDPFFTTKSEGTGLGLSIIHRIIDAYDGMMDFESVPGRGTVFTLIFQNA